MSPDHSVRALRGSLFDVVIPEYWGYGGSRQKAVINFSRFLKTAKNSSREDAVLKYFDEKNTTIEAASGRLFPDARCFIQKGYP